MERLNRNDPAGAFSHINVPDNHVDVHISYSDIVASAKWIGAEFHRGDAFMPGDVHMASVWQIDFPRHGRREEGSEHTCRVTSFPPNIEIPR